MEEILFGGCLAAVTNPGVTAVLSVIAQNKDRIREWEMTPRCHGHTALCVGRWLCLYESGGGTQLQQLTQLGSEYTEALELVKGA